MKIISFGVLVLAFNCISSYKLDYSSASHGNNPIKNILDGLSSEEIEKITGGSVTVNGNVTVQVFQNVQTCCNKKSDSVDSDTSAPIKISNNGYKAILKDDRYTTAVKYYPPGKTWNEARETCSHEGGFLAYASNKEEEDLYLKIIDDHNVTDIWIGIHDFFHQGHWSTVLGENVDNVAYVKWRPGNPDNLGGNERCTHLNNNRKGLNDVICDNKYAFICKIKLPNCLYK